ncbi:MAG: hypothetical protein AAF742_06150 [Pseudomonadota bacterium]
MRNKIDGDGRPIPWQDDVRTILLRFFDALRDVDGRLSCGIEALRANDREAVLRSSFSTTLYRAAHRPAYGRVVVSASSL